MMWQSYPILAVLVIAPIIEALYLCPHGAGAVACLLTPGQSPGGNGPVDTLFNQIRPVGIVTVGTNYNQSFEALFDTGKYSPNLRSRSYFFRRWQLQTRRK